MKLEDVFEQYKDDIYLNYFKILNLSSSSLLDPCYNPPISSLFKQYIKTSLFRDILSKNNFDMSEYISNNIIKKVQPYKLFRDETVWFLLLTSLYFNSKAKKDSIDNEIIFLSTFLLLLKYYTSLSIKHMSKFCDKAKAILALNTLSDKSLFSAKNKRVTQIAYSIVNAQSLNSKIKNSIKNSNIALGIVYLAQGVINKYYKRVLFDKPKDIAKLIIIFRSRISQSFKAYAQHYYDIAYKKLDETADMTMIENGIHQVVNSNAQRLVFISDNHFDMVSKMSEVPTPILKTMYEITYRNSEIYDVILNVINIYFSDGRFKYLQEIDTVYEWLTIIRSVVAIRSKYEIRTLLMQIITSNDELNNLYNEKSDSFKHKMIQGLGGVIALSIYDSIRVRGLSSFSNYANII